VDPIAEGPKASNKLYSLDEPATRCIRKGKAQKRYEFGQKVSLAGDESRRLVPGGAVV
jgi:IS5 family transposase